MDNVGGIRGTSSFEGGRVGSSAENSGVYQRGMGGRSVEEPIYTPELGGEAVGEGLNLAAERSVRDPRLENALGVATVGATGVTPEREEQLVEQAFRSPNDVRTEDEIRIGAPEVAKDGDKLEKEWIEKARELVRETKDDPHQRLVGAALLREEYMRKRFNRILGERN